MHHLPERPSLRQKADSCGELEHDHPAIHLSPLFSVAQPSLLFSAISTRPNLKLLVTRRRPKQFRKAIGTPKISVNTSTNSQASTDILPISRTYRTSSKASKSSKYSEPTIEETVSGFHLQDCRAVHVICKAGGRMSSPKRRIETDVSGTIRDGAR